MQLFQPDVATMLSAINPHDSGPSGSENLPPSPASLTGPLVDHCQLSRAEQIWQAEDLGFERRLKREVLKRSQKGWNNDRLERFARHHRRRWAQQRLKQMPESVRRRENPYADLHDAASAPFRPDLVPFVEVER